MPLVLAAFEVMDKEPPLWFIVLVSFSTGAVGMLVARRRPVLSAFFVAILLLGSFALYLELADSFVGASIVKEGGVVHLGGCAAAILAGVGMPIFGAVAGAKKIPRDAASWRWTSGISGTVLLGFALFMGSAFLESLYYDYVLYPKEKAGEGYIAPLRWQDIVAETSIACVLIGLLLLSTYLLGLRSGVEEPVESRFVPDEYLKRTNQAKDGRRARRSLNQILTTYGGEPPFPLGLALALLLLSRV